MSSWARTTPAFSKMGKSDLLPPSTPTTGLRTGVFCLTFLGDPLSLSPILAILGFLSCFLRNVIPLEDSAANISRSVRRGQEEYVPQELIKALAQERTEHHFVPYTYLIMCMMVYVLSELCDLPLNEKMAQEGNS